jgi:hypothetical protein
MQRNILIAIRYLREGQVAYRVPRYTEHTDKAGAPAKGDGPFRISDSVVSQSRVEEDRRDEYELKGKKNYMRILYVAPWCAASLSVESSYVVHSYVFFN